MRAADDGGGVSGEERASQSWKLGGRTFVLAEETKVVLPQRGHLRVEAIEVFPSREEIVCLLRDDSPPVSEPKTPTTFFRVCSMSFSGGPLKEILRLSPEALFGFRRKSSAVFAATLAERALLLGSYLWWAGEDWSFEPVGSLHSELEHDLVPLSAAMTSQGLYLAYGMGEGEVAKVVLLKPPGTYHHSFGVVGSDLLKLHAVGDRVVVTDLFRLIFQDGEEMGRERDLADFFPGAYVGTEIVTGCGEGSLFVSNGQRLVLLETESLEVVAEGTLPSTCLALWGSEETIFCLSMDDHIGMFWIRRYTS